MGGVCTQSVQTLPDAKSVLSGTQIPEWVSAAGRQLYEQSAEMAASPFPTYTGERVATYGNKLDAQGNPIQVGTDSSGNPIYEQSRLTGEEQDAATLLSQGTSTFDQYITDAETMAGTLGQGYTPATSAALTGSAFDIAAAQPFLDIYQTAQDPAVQEIQDQTDRGLISNAAEAARMGAFGGSRLGLREAETVSQGARAAGDLRSRAAAEGLAFAGQRFDSDREARFAAEDRARSAYETEEASRLRATEELQSFAPLVQGLTEQAASGLLTSGQAKRQLDQMALDLAYSDYVEQREYPFQMLNFAQGALQGTPYETRTIGLEQGQQYVQSPSVYGQTIGGLGSLASAYYLGNR
tara:strand:- start:39 stop:1097 length:1059 start_codon:yes stop_codon:yes gene_type:complete